MRKRLNKGGKSDIYKYFQRYLNFNMLKVIIKWVNFSTLISQIIVRKIEKKWWLLESKRPYRIGVIQERESLYQSAYPTQTG